MTATDELPIVTLRTVYNKVESIEDKIDEKLGKQDERIRTLQIQVAAMWVIHTLIIAVLTTTLGSTINRIMAVLP